MKKLLLLTLTTLFSCTLFLGCNSSPEVLEQISNSQPVNETIKNRERSAQKNLKEFRKTLLISNDDITPEFISELYSTYLSDNDSPIKVLELRIDNQNDSDSPTDIPYIIYFENMDDDLTISSGLYFGDKSTKDIDLFLNKVSTILNSKN